MSVASGLPQVTESTLLRWTSTIRQLRTYSCPPWSVRMTAWGSWDEAAFDAYLPSNMVLGMADIAVIAADRLGNLLYLNEYAARMFRIPGSGAQLAGQPLLSLGLVAEA